MRRTASVARSTGSAELPRGLRPDRVPPWGFVILARYRGSYAARRLPLRPGVHRYGLPPMEPLLSTCSITKQPDGDRVVLRVSGVFDRASAWKLREHIEREGPSELLLDFSQVRDFSDLGMAVLAHALSRRGQRVLFRGLRQHELRILRYCGVAVDETSARQAETAPAAERGPPPSDVPPESA